MSQTDDTTADESTPYGEYHAAILALANATDDLTRALVAWHRAKDVAEEAWGKLPERRREVHYSPDCLSPTRDPAVRSVLRPPEHLLGLSITSAAAPPA